MKLGRQRKAGAFSLILKTDGSFAALDQGRDPKRGAVPAPDLDVRLRARLLQHGAALAHRVHRHDGTVHYLVLCLIHILSTETDILLWQYCPTRGTK